ncbi:lysylphosphatidylglycerol synthase domain-containing protein [Ideonella sp.]|uniref:lysylphosphatidylglycerol synthase domain-containing protein n=1 Tax=Ideonella sp. TaxID=1929293 RepID=UPI0035B1F8CF
MAADAIAPPPAPAGLTTRPWWPAAQRAFWTLCLLITAVLLVETGRHWDWSSALAALRGLPRTALLAGLGFAAVGHVLYASYDVLGREPDVALAGAGAAVPSRWVLAVGFVSFAFKLNLGTLLGGVALRYRLYSRLGMTVDEITRILASSVLTNWLGYTGLAGLLLLWRPPVLPAGWALGDAALQALGVGMVLVTLAYAAACYWAEGHQWRWRRHVITLPSLRMALAQLALSALHWALTAAVCWALLERQVDFASVLNALLVSAVAGLITHVPGGLGVLEAIFLALLQHRAGQADLLAAMLGYRVIYYVLPLALATLLFFVIDRHRRAR